MDTQTQRLPTDWQFRPIEDVYRFTKKPKRLQIKDLSEVPFIPMDLIPLGRVFADEWIMKPTAELGSGTYFESGDLLVAKITPSFENGKQAIARINAPFGYATTEVIPIQEVEGISDKFYLHFFLLHPEVRKELTEKMDGSTGRQRLRKDVLASKFISLPPLKEQQKIAYILTSVRSAIDQQSQLIKLTSELKSSLLQKLFAEGIYGEQQKQTEVGSIPANWQVVKLSQIVGETQSVDLRLEAERTIQYIDVSSISRDFLRVETTTKYILKNSPGRARKKVKTGDVIFATIRPTLLRVAFIGEELSDQVCSTAFCVLRAKDKEIERFIYYVVQRKQFLNQLAAFESGASYPAVTDNQVKEQYIPLPPPEERTLIVEILYRLDQKKYQHARKKALLEELFRTLLNQLMTGLVPVNDIELPDISVR